MQFNLNTNLTVDFSYSGAYAGYINYFKQPIFASDCTTIQTANEKDLDSDFLYYVLKNRQKDFYKFQQGMGQPHVYAKDFQYFKIPLSPLNVQKEIVSEIEVYQKLVKGAQEVDASWKPWIEIDPKWPTIKLGEICSFKNGLNFNKSESGYLINIIGVGDFQNLIFASFSDLETIKLSSPITEDYLLQEDDILFVRSNVNSNLVGRSMIVSRLSSPTTFSGFTIRGQLDTEKVLPLFMLFYSNLLNLLE